MKNKTRQFLDNLIRENNELRTENERLKNQFICDYIGECEELVKANLTISKLRNELAREKHRNELLAPVR